MSRCCIVALVALLLAPSVAGAQPAEKPDPAHAQAEAPDPTLRAAVPRPPTKPRPRRPARPQPPVARKVTVKVPLVSGELVDDYAWLKDKKNPDVLAYLAAENAYTDAVMAPTKALQDRLYAEMLSRVQEDDTDVPVKKGGYLYAWQTAKGKPQKTYVRWKAGRDDAPVGDPQVLLDLNELANGGSVASVWDVEVSDDGRLLAYTLDNTGGLDFKLRVVDLATRRVIDGPVDEVSSVAWAADGKALLYSTMDSAKRSHRIWRRRLGSKGRDRLVLEENDARFDITVERSKDKAWLLIKSESKTTSETWTVPATNADASPRSVAGRTAGVEYDVAPRGDTFFIRANSTGRTWAVFTSPAAPAADLRPPQWTPLIEARSDVNIDDIDVTRDHLVVFDRVSGKPRVRFFDRKGGEREVSFAEPSYSLYYGRGTSSRRAHNPEIDVAAYRLKYTSLVTPTQTIDVDLATLKQTVKKEQPVPGYDRTKYVTERFVAIARDGVEVPVSLVYRKGIKRNGKNPLLLYGYGSYGITTDPSFIAPLVSLLDRGVVYAVAHIRGSGDLGKPWHDAGRMLNKRNTFTDFIAVAETLIAKRYTSRQRLAIEGRSAGGLLVGAVVTMRPDLFKVALPGVAFVDVINSMLDESLPLTVGEFEEWGNPKKKEELAYMLTYSPYDNVKRRAYPAMLLRSGLNDNQVLFHEPTKFVAKLRAMKTDKNPLLLVMNMGAGHGGSSGRYDALRERAHDWAFLLTQLGITK
jgi:oligopeptidase B